MESVFYDENAFEYPDPDNSEAEERFIILGLSAGLRILVVCYAVMKDETDSRQNSPSFSSHDRKLKNDLERPVPSGEACINRP